MTLSATLCSTPLIISPRPLITLFAIHGISSDNFLTGAINSACAKVPALSAAIGFPVAARTILYVVSYKTCRPPFKTGTIALDRFVVIS